MLVRLGSFCAVLCLALLVETQADVKVENNAYHNVVVSFLSRTSPENAKELVDSMKQLLSETSSVLQKAIGLRIGSVVFHLPDTWDTSQWEGVSPASVSSSEYSPNLRVETTDDSAFGQQPYALQYSECGVPGLEISIPEGFLSTVTVEEDHTKGKLLAREWLKYRYGVFDENGFQKDSKYPAYYAIPGSDDIHVTDCTSPQAEYYFKNSTGHNCTLTIDGLSDCSIHLEEEGVQNITSSLMFYHEELTNVEHVCGKDDHHHNVNSPNKHNLLCKHKSIWEILELSDDFKNIESTGSEEEIKFSYVQESKFRVAIAWQNTKSLTKQGNSILHAVRKVVYDLPEYSKFTLFSFSDQPNEVKGLTEVTTDADRSVMLPSNFLNPIEPCVSCALHAVADIILADSQEQKGTIVVITASDPAEDADLIGKLTNPQLCLLVLAFPGASKEGWSKLTSLSPCSSILEIPDSDDDKQTFETLFNSMESIIPLPADNSRTTTIATDWLTFTNPISIPADDTAKNITLWIFHVFEADSITCKLGADDIKLSPGSHSQNLVSFTFTPQTAEVKCSLKYEYPTPFLTQVRKTTEPGAYFKMDTFIHDLTPKGSKEQMPVIVYARLYYGSYPIRNAQVKATVRGPNELEKSFQLFDTGMGEPDITQNDGIYSRYFTDFSADGEYTVTIEATDNEKNAKGGKKGENQCCGSEVISETFEIGSFHLTSDANFHAVSKKPDEGYKPSRIVDFRVDELKLPHNISLKWTAPGGETDHGEAHHYNLKIFTSLEDALDIFDNTTSAKEIVTELTPKVIGEPEIFQLQIEEFDNDDFTYYLTIRSTNVNNQTSQTSNILAVHIPSDTKNTITPITTTDTPTPTSGMAPRTIGLITGITILVVIVIVCIFVAVYLAVIKPKRKEAKKSKNNESTERNPTSVFGLNSIPADIIIKHHNEVVDAKTLHKDPPIFKEETIVATQAPTNSSDNLSQNNNADYTLPNNRRQMPNTQENPPKSPKRMTVV